MNRSDDTIRRQSAIDAVEKESQVDGAYGYMDTKSIVDLLMDLPSAEKRGRWVKLDIHPHLADHKCTACGESTYVPTCMGKPIYLFCPWCGARMEGEEDETAD